MRSFDLVDFKIGEAEYFLQKIFKSKDIFEVQFLFSAFVSASRSVTFCLQSVLNDAPGFKSWYDLKQNTLRENQLAKFFVEARNLSQKVGVVPISFGSLRKGRVLHFFDSTKKDFKHVPKDDVVTSCKEYFKLVLRLVYDCYVDFGVVIDPHQYFTKANYLRLGKTIDDADEYFTGIKGYTGVVEGWPEEYRWQALRNSTPGCRITDFFPKYLDLYKPHPPMLPTDPKKYDGKSWVPPCLTESRP